MYVFFGVLILILILCSLLQYYRKRKICCKIRCMDMEEKCAVLNSITEPFGFCYEPCQDIFVSTLDAWQKSFGYCRLYDDAAPTMNMIFDCEPIYFRYRNRTWLIEFWKGQYGINTGAEVGIYYADSVLHEKDYASTLFHAVPETDLLPISLELLKLDGSILLRLSKPHWWLAAFRMGMFSYPYDLRLRVSITFPNEEMKRCYIKGLTDAGYSSGEIFVRQLTVSVCFSVPYSVQPKRRIRTRIAQWMNRQFLRLYIRFTKPFCETADRLLYLYYFAPKLFRKALSARGRKRRIHKKGLRQTGKR